MKRVIGSLAIALLALTLTAQGQDTATTARVEKQHKTSRFQRQHMQQTEEGILQALEGKSPGMQQSAIQTLRQMAQSYPEYPFSTLISPLGDRLADSQTDGVVRILAALALDELHSEAGDAVIRKMADASNDKSLQTLCSALLVKSDNK